MKIKAYGKVNLGLDVIGKRPDGYHELDMIMSPIDLYDDIAIELSDKDWVISDVPIPKENTVTKAVHLMRERYEFKEHFAIRIAKHIPMQAGLAGGSTDAAAVIRGLVSMLSLETSTEELLEIGKEIGADVPFCMVGKLARVRGIGEIIEPFSTNLSLPCLLVRPNSGVNTAEAFKALKEPIFHPDIRAIRDAMMDDDYTSFIRSLGNSLEGPATSMVPEIATIKSELIAMGFDACIMTGSGSTVIGFSRNRTLLEEAAKRYKSLFTHVTVILNS